MAGGLHLLLYTFARQGDETRYDARPLARNSKQFHFGNQVWDNMLWTLAGALPLGTLWECACCCGPTPTAHATLITFEREPALVRQPGC